MAKDGSVVLYDNADFEWPRWFFTQSWGDIPNFTCVYPTLWWCTNINDRVRSIENNALSNFTVFFEHVNFGGSQLWVTEGIVSDLSMIGWSDRISSMAYRDQM
jgi:hypothetical protein